ncbi:IQ calmodulin-binding motif-containing protein 1-like [Salminus brasiliensis]|uniref:IQ calmodulin-binding motif-containing protein 1-like n=1 Tax=Salminus brasiliensis TaxID=930266 RepID=UPI003B837A7E
MGSPAEAGEDISPALKTLITEEPEHSFIQVLSKTKELLGRKSVGEQQDLQRCKQGLYQHGVLAYCSAALKFNPAKIEGSYASVTQMADLISTCCVGIGSVRDRDVFLHRFLPSVTENLLFFAHRLMKRAVVDKGQSEMLRLFRKVFDSLSWILRAYSHLIPCVLHSKHYESVQMSEDDEVSSVTLMMWHNLFRINSAVLSEMGTKALSSVVDDVVYKMSSSSNPVIGSAATKILLLIIEQHSQSLQLLHKHYKGLDDLVRKDWQGKGFDVVLEQLIDRLQAEVPERGFKAKRSTEEQNRAACVIQAAWRAHQTRSRIKKLPKAVSALQRSFRERRRRQQEETEKRRTEEELRHHVLLRRQRAMRQFRQRQLHLMEILPADQVARYLGELENRAALLIQRVWRGHRERRCFQKSKYQLRQHKAAVTLQRAILRFLKRQRSRRTILTPWKGPRGLTDSRRTELRRQIEEHISLHPSSVASVEGTRELHEKAQCMLQHHLMTRASVRAQEQHRQALLAQINTDMELLLNAPSLKDAGEEESALFLSRSAPVAMCARQSHNALLQSMRLPWWRTLGDEFSNPETLSHMDHDTEFESLYLGGNL